MSDLPIVLILGRPNVGKSALFNRISQRRKSIVHPFEGVTRDIVAVDTDWNGRAFRLVDSGGLDFTTGDEIKDQVQEMALSAIQSATLLLLVVDAKSGLHPLDREIAQQIRAGGKPVLLVANKVDSREGMAKSFDFFSLGLEDPIPVSGLNGFNIGDLLDEISLRLPAGETTPPSPVPKIAIVGRPNVGKSSLLNALLGRKQAIVAGTPGTTRDAVDSPWVTKKGSYLLVDTAGIRHKSKVSEDVEYYSILRATEAIKRSDMVLLLVDAEAGILSQDRKIAGLIQQAEKACLIGVNKVDRVDFVLEKKDQFLAHLQHELDFIAYAETAFISAKTGFGLSQIPQYAQTILESYFATVTTGKLNRVLRDILDERPPPANPMGGLKIFYATQRASAPPTFLLFANRPQNLHFSYERHLKTEFRNRLGLVGTPVRLELRSRER
jgi:GTP-binding protein